MKKISCSSLILFMTAVLLPSARLEATVSTGKPAPPIKGKTLNGTTFRLSDYRGKVVLLDFWMPECPPCIVEMPLLQKLQKKYYAQGLRVIGIAESAPSAPAAKRFAKQLGVTYPLLLDTKETIFKKYGLSVHPTTILIDAKGTIRRVDEGFVKGDEQEIEKAIRPLLTSSGKGGTG